MSAYEFAVYGLVVTNLTLGTTHHCLQGERHDPAAAVYLADSAQLSAGQARDTFPSSRPDPLEASLSFYAKTAADVPAWQPGHVIRYRLVFPALNDTHDAVRPDWYTDAVLDDGLLGALWADVTLIVSEPISARAVAIRDAAGQLRQGGLLVTYTLMDPITAVTGLPVTTTRVVEEASTRYAALVDAFVPDVLFGYPVTKSVSLLTAGNPAGPGTFDGAALGDVLTDLLAGVDFAGSLPTFGLVFDHDTDTWEWKTGLLNRVSHDASTPYRLVLVGDTAVRQTKDLDEVNTPQGQPREVFLPACHVPSDAVSWQYLRGVNALRLATMNSAGDQTAYVHTYDELADRHGVRLREVQTQRKNPPTGEIGYSNGALAEVYLGDTASASPQWQATGLTIETHEMNQSELIRSYLAFQIDPDTTNEPTPLVQLGIIGVDGQWALGPNQGDIHGTVTRWTFEITGGRLRIGTELLPFVPEPGPQGPGSNPDSAVTIQDLKDSATLAAVQPDEVPAGAPHIDPTLTPYDMRVIGV